MIQTQVQVILQNLIPTVGVSFVKVAGIKSYRMKALKNVGCVVKFRSLQIKKRFEGSTHSSCILLHE